MKITRLEILKIPPNWVWLKIHTDEGLIGLGQAPGLGIELDEDGLKEIMTHPWSERRG